jgi:hypothetical protein
MAGTLFTTWENITTAYLSQLFSGSNTGISDLWSLIQDGMMLTLPRDIDLSNLTTLGMAAFYSQLLQVAWSIAPENLAPFVL